MSDIKSIKTLQKARRGRRRAPRFAAPLRRPLLNEMLVSSRWEYGQLSSNSSGILSAADISPSIQNSSEYSGPWSGTFSEVKLVSCRITFGPSFNPSAGITPGVAVVGTHMTDNQTTHASTPLVAADVQNLFRKKQFNIGTGQVRVYYYQMYIPPDLEFSLISADAPATPTPWAGSPGCVRIFADHISTTQAYLNVWVEAIHWLRGRH